MSLSSFVTSILVATLSRGLESPSWPTLQICESASRRTYSVRDRFRWRHSFSRPSPFSLSFSLSHLRFLLSFPAKLLRVILALDLAVDIAILMVFVSQLTLLRIGSKHVERTISRLSYVFFAVTLLSSMVIIGELVINFPRSVSVDLSRSFIREKLELTNILSNTSQGSGGLFAITITFAPIISPLYTFSLLSILNSRSDVRLDHLIGRNDIGATSNEVTILPNPTEITQRGPTTTFPSDFEEDLMSILSEGRDRSRREFNLLKKERQSMEFGSHSECESRVAVSEPFDYFWIFFSDLKSSPLSHSCALNLTILISRPFRTSVPTL